MKKGKETNCKSTSMKTKKVKKKVVNYSAKTDWTAAWQKSKEIEKEAAAHEINYLLGRMRELVNILTK